MSVAQNELINQWEGQPGRTIHSPSVLATGQKVYKGSLAMMVSGKVYPAQVLSSGFGASLILNVAGVDVNGGMRVWAKQANVTYRQFGGASQTLGVSVNFFAGNVEIKVQLGTDAMGVPTSTAKDVYDKLSGHGLASKYVKAYYTGNGLGLTSVLAPAAVPHVYLLGSCEETYDNAAGLTDLVIDMRFTKGLLRLAGLPGDVPVGAMIGSSVAVNDNTTVRATINALDLTVELADVDGTSIYCNLDKE